MGVGINLLPHAVGELTELGLGGELEAAGIATSEQAHFDRHGNLIWSEPRGRGLGYNWPQYSIHRGELQTMLLAAVRHRLGDDAVTTGTAVTGFTERAGAVEILLFTRPAGPAVAVSADVLVGADGLNSAVRAQLHPGEPPPRWNGVRMWRGVTEGQPFLSGSSVAIAGTNTAAKFVAYPVARTGHGTVLINWVGEVRTGDGQAARQPDWDRSGHLADVLPCYADWKFPWLDVPDLITRSPKILEYPMVDRDPLPSWGRGRVTLAGRGPPDVPGRLQRRLPGSHRRTGAGPQAGRGQHPRRRPGRLRNGQADDGQRYRAGQPGQSSRPGTADGKHSRTTRVRPDRGRAEPNAMGFRYLGCSAGFRGLVTVSGFWVRACRRPACCAG